MMHQIFLLTFITLSSLLFSHKEQIENLCLKVVDEKNNLVAKAPLESSSDDNKPVSSKSVLEVSGELVCASLEDYDEVIGVGQDNHLILSNDVTISKQVLFKNVVIVGQTSIHKSLNNKKFSIETIGLGSVKFGENVILKDCTIKNLKQTRD